DGVAVIQVDGGEIVPANRPPHHSPILVPIGVVRLAVPVVPGIRLAGDPAPAAVRLPVVRRGAVLVEADPAFGAVRQVGEDELVLRSRGNGDQVARQPGIRNTGGGRTRLRPREAG